MSNPATKNNLESEHFLSTSLAVRTRLTACLRADSANIRPFSTPSPAIEAIKKGLNIVQPRIPDMKKITDPENTFGDSMVAAVKAYKEFNGIIRTGQKLDFIVGRGTLARLDTELKNAGKTPEPAPVVLEFGSKKFRFSFFANKGVFGKGTYSLFIGSTEVQDSRNFDIDEVAAGGGLLDGFRGEVQGSFSTEKKMAVKDFESSAAFFTVVRQSRTLSGNMQLQKVVGDGVQNVSFSLPRFQDKSIALKDGAMVVRGQLQTGR